MEKEVLQLYYWPTPNGWKVTILLEEIGLPYQVVPVNIGRGDQFTPEFLRISPNNKMPAIVDPDGPGAAPLSVFESGAIMIYLADKKSLFLPKNPRERSDALQWLMFQVGSVGPMLGQLHHFRNYALKQIEYAVTRYSNEARRIYAVLDKQLADHEYLAGDYSIADMSVFPWIVPYKKQGIDLAKYPAVQRWFERINARPAVQRGLAVMNEARSEKPDEKAREFLFDKKF